MNNIRNLAAYILLLMVFVSCSKDEPEVSKLSIHVQYKEYEKYTTPERILADKGAKIYIFKDINIHQSDFEFDGVDKMSDGKSTVGYMNKGVADEDGDFTFDGLPYGTHAVAVISNKWPTKWLVTSIKLDTPTDKLDFQIDEYR